MKEKKDKKARCFGSPFEITLEQTACFNEVLAAAIARLKTFYTFEDVDIRLGSKDCTLIEAFDRLNDHEPGRKTKGYICGY